MYSICETAVGWNFYVKQSVILGKFNKHTGILKKDYLIIDTTLPPHIRKQNICKGVKTEIIFWT